MNPWRWLFEWRTPQQQKDAAFDAATEAAREARHQKEIEEARIRLQRLADEAVVMAREEQ